jgi:2-haloalkanoic acid dehalogenase type II
MTTDRPVWASFDCYGTLIDWEGGAAAFLYDYALAHGDEPAENGDALRRRWEEIQFELISGPYQTYKAIMAASLRRWAEERGYPYSDVDGIAFVRAMRSWQPFPDTAPALHRARATGLKLAILSNTDRDIIAHSLKHIGVPFDLVVTAEDVGAYKPSRDNFVRLLQEIGLPAGDVLHVAFGFKYDAGPAHEMGMRTAWVNRHVEAAPPEPLLDHIWRDLWGLPAAVGGKGTDFP